MALCFLLVVRLFEAYSSLFSNPSISANSLTLCTVPARMLGFLSSSRAYVSASRSWEYSNLSTLNPEVLSYVKSVEETKLVVYIDLSLAVNTGSPGIFLSMGIDLLFISLEDLRKNRSGVDVSTTSYLRGKVGLCSTDWSSMCRKYILE